MIKKRGRPMVAEKGVFLSPSSVLLDSHFDELLETIEEIRGLTAILKTLPPANEKREEYEGRLYAALTHLDHHVKPAIKEWDRVVDRMPNDCSLHVWMNRSLIFRASPHDSLSRSSQCTV